VLEATGQFAIFRGVLVIARTDQNRSTVYAY